MASGRVAAPGAVTELPATVAAELRALLGDRLEVDEATRREHACDWWPIAKVWALVGEVAALPAAVARPIDGGEVATVLEVCARSRIPVTPSAGRSGVCGQTVPVAGGVALDLRGLDRVLEIDDRSLTVTAEAGVFGPALEDALQGEGLTVGHFPQSFAISTVGGWLACRSAGQYSTRYGKIEDLVLGLEVAVPGARLSFPPVPASAAGPDLMRLFLGAEGTLGVITQVTLRVRPLPPAERRVAFGFATFSEGLDAVRRVLRRGAAPAVVRLYDPGESARHFDEDRAVLIVLAEGEEAEVEWQASVVRAESAEAAELDPGLVRRWLEHRNDVSALDHAIAAGLVVDTMEVAALWRDLPRVHDGVTRALEPREGLLGVTAHCSHVYASGACLYFTFAGAPAPERADGWYAGAWAAALAAAVAAGATLSHHHGIGLVRGRAYADGLAPAERALLQSVKDSLDPIGILNPGKLGLADRLGVGTSPWPPGG